MTDAELLRKYGFKPSTYYIHSFGWYMKDGRTYDHKRALELAKELHSKSLFSPMPTTDRDTRIHDPLVDLGGEG